MALGDTFCAFDPIYGQGMSVPAMEAVLLRGMLAASLLQPNTHQHHAGKHDAETAHLEDSPQAQTTHRA